LVVFIKFKINKFATPLPVHAFTNTATIKVQTF
jgi:hypothetical protein